MTTTARAQAEQIAERLRFQPTPKSSSRITLSVGVAELTLADNARSFIAPADEDLYAAKADGKNTACYLQAVHVAGPRLARHNGDSRRTAGSVALAGGVKRFDDVPVLAEGTDHLPHVLEITARGHLTDG